MGGGGKQLKLKQQQKRSGGGGGHKGVCVSGEGEMERFLFIQWLDQFTADGCDALLLCSLVK